MFYFILLLGSVADNVLVQTMQVGIAKGYMYLTISGFLCEINRTKLSLKNAFNNMINMKY
jgi:hypothetical protein